MRVFPLLTAVRILITVGTTSANSPTILVATNTQQPVAISVAGPYRQIDVKSLPVLDSEALYSSVFSQQCLQCAGRDFSVPRLSTDVGHFRRTSP
jgi:hypothetical protein